MQSWGPGPCVDSAVLERKTGALLRQASTQCCRTIPSSSSFDSGHFALQDAYADRAKESPQSPALTLTVTAPPMSSPTYTGTLGQVHLSNTGQQTLLQNNWMTVDSPVSALGCEVDGACTTSSCADREVTRFACSTLKVGIKAIHSQFPSGASDAAYSNQQRYA